MNKLINIPNILTASRIALLPFFILSFFLSSRFGSVLAVVIFVLCSITDYLDGYWARTYKQTTKLGQMLDPLADKIFISITILFMAGFGKISTYSLLPAAIILCREIIVSDIRNAINFRKKKIATANLAQWKTATQMIAISLLLISDIFECIILANIFWLIGEIIFWFSAFISIVSGFRYCRFYIKDLLKQKHLMTQKKD